MLVFPGKQRVCNCDCICFHWTICASDVLVLQRSLKGGLKGLCIWFQTYSAGYFFGNRATVTLQFLNISPAIQKNLYILLVNKSLLYMHPTCLFHVSAGLWAKGMFAYLVLGLQYQIHSLVATTNFILMSKENVTFQHLRWKRNRADQMWTLYIIGSDETGFAQRKKTTSRNNNLEKK